MIKDLIQKIKEKLKKIFKKRGAKQMVFPYGHYRG